MKYLILGATGTLGRAMISRLIEDPKTEVIRCLSRDELKLSVLKKDFRFKPIETVIGDIRDKPSVARHFSDIDVVFHFAALKRIPELEKQPLESLKTNVLGTVNAAELALENNVKHFIFSSTDKACLPINTYGASKFLAEQILFSFQDLGKTNFSIFRWGNVIGSRGSVISAFSEAIKDCKFVDITHPDMTRFWIKIEAAVDFILKSYHHKNKEVRVPYMRSAGIMDVLSAVSGSLNVSDYNVNFTGIRPGEKLHENILFDEAYCLTSLNSPKYTISELRELMKGVV